MFELFTPGRTGTLLPHDDPEPLGLGAAAARAGRAAALAYGAMQMARPFVLGQPTPISLDPAYLPYYLLRTILRMFMRAGLLAAVQLRVRRRWPRASAAPKRCMVPMLDILQSVPDPGFPGHRHRPLHRAVPRQPARRRMRGDLRDLHLAGLEHGVQPVPVDAHGAARTGGGGARVPAVRVAALLAPGTAVRDAGRCCGT